MPSLENFIFSRCFSHCLYFKSSISISLPSHLRDSDIYIYLLCSRYSVGTLKANRPELSPGSSPWTTHTLNFLFYICWFLFIKTPWFRLGIMLNSSLSIWPISIQGSGSISHSGWLLIVSPSTTALIQVLSRSLFVSLPPVFYLFNPSSPQSPGLFLMPGFNHVTPWCKSLSMTHYHL